MPMLTLFLQVTGANWLWPMLPSKFQVPADAPTIATERASLFSLVDAVPGRFEAASLNG